MARQLERERAADSRTIDDLELLRVALGEPARLALGCDNPGGMRRAATKRDVAPHLPACRSRPR